VITVRHPAHTPDRTTLPIIIRTGFCGHHRRIKHGATQPARTKAAQSSRKTERRVSRRGALWRAPRHILWHKPCTKRGKAVRTASRALRWIRFHLIESRAWV